MSNKELKPLVIIGGGGHAGVLVDILRMQRRKINAVICPDDIDQRAVFEGILHLKHDDDVFMFPANEILLVNGIGMLPRSMQKYQINEYFLELGYQFETVVSDGAFVSPYAYLDSGVQVFPRAIVQAGTIIGSNSIINSGAIVEHDCSIGSYNHIAPGSVVCGQVKTESNVYVGANATIIQNIKLGEGCIIGAGAVVTKSMLSKKICYPHRMTVR